MINLKQVKWNLILIATLANVALMSLYMSVYDEYTFLRFAASVLMFPVIGFLLAFNSRPKGCLAGKTEDEKHVFFESLYDFKYSDKSFYKEQLADLKDEEKAEFLNWILNVETAKKNCFLQNDLSKPSLSKLHFFEDFNRNKYFKSVLSLSDEEMLFYKGWKISSGLKSDKESYFKQNIDEQHKTETFKSLRQIKHQDSDTYFNCLEKFNDEDQGEFFLWSILEP